MKKLLILGAGGYGRTVYDIAKQLGCYDKIGFLDDAGTGANILGNSSEYALFADENTYIYPAFGNNALRLQWLRKLEEEQIQIPVLVHPTAYVSPAAKLGIGTVILPKAVVNTGCVIKNGCIVNIGALVDHDVVMEEGSHAAPGAIIKAENRIPPMMKVESGTVIENRQYPL